MNASSQSRGGALRDTTLNCTIFCAGESEPLYIDVPLPLRIEAYDMSSNTLLGSMMLPVISDDCTFQMTLKGLSPDTSELALQLFAIVSHETESDDPEWGSLDYGTACSGTINVSASNSYDVSLQCGGTSVCLPWIYEVAQYEDDSMYAVVLRNIANNTQSALRADWQTVAETLSHINEAFPNTLWIGDTSMYDISGSGTYSVLEWAQVNGYLRQQSINTAYSSHVLIFCTLPTANDITQYLNNACNSLSFQTMSRSECIN